MSAVDDEAVGQFFNVDGHFGQLDGHALDSVGFLEAGLGDVEQLGCAVGEGGGDGHSGQCVGRPVHIYFSAFERGGLDYYAVRSDGNIGAHCFQVIDDGLVGLAVGEIQAEDCYLVAEQGGGAEEEGCA